MIRPNRYPLTPNTNADKRVMYFAIWMLLSTVVFWKLSFELFQLSRTNDDASHIVLVPFISLWLIYLEREKIFEQTSYDFRLSGIFFAISAILFFCVQRFAGNWTFSDTLSGYALCLVILWLAGFALFFGRGAFRSARFPLFLLMFSIPLPEAVLNPIIYFLQKGSADIAEIIFDLCGVPALREGFVFHLAHVNIEVAKECSGIRSSLALLILALLVGHMFLKSFWKQAIFVVAGIFVMILKNGVRIATLTILAQYVDRGFLFGRLHHQGGVVFFLLGLVLLVPILWILQRGDKPEKTLQHPVAG
jgi:exosortase